jgi:protein-disulfide isomerase
MCSNAMRMAIGLVAFAASVEVLAGARIAPSTSAAVPDFDLAGSPVRGDSAAPVTIVEFSDFQCGFCARATATVERLLERYPGKVRWVMKHYPLDLHQAAPLAHRAALAAAAQGKFWEMHDAIFAEQRALTRERMLRHASGLSLDRAKFARDMNSARVKSLLERDVAEGRKVGIDGTPTFFINGERLVGAVAFETMAAAVERALVRSLAATPDGLEELMSRGPAAAPVTIRWFADLSIALHRDALVMLKQVDDARPGLVRIVFKNLPSGGRQYSRALHEAAIAGAAQGRFWDLHDVLMSRGAGQTREGLINLAARLGLDRTGFAEAMTMTPAAGLLERQAAEARRLDVRGTPTFFVNDTRVDGVIPAEDMIKLVDARLKPVP